MCKTNAMVLLSFHESAIDLKLCTPRVFSKNSKRVYVLWGEPRYSLGDLDPFILISFLKNQRRQKGWAPPRCPGKGHREEGYLSHSVGHMPPFNSPVSSLRQLKEVGGCIFI